MKIFGRKTILIVAAIVGLNYSYISVNAEDELKLDVSYNIETRVLNFSGNVSNNANEFLIIRIKKYSDPEDYSNEAMGKEQYVITRTVETDVDGNIDSFIILPETFLGNRYTYVFSSPTEKQTGVFAAVDLKVIEQMANEASSADKKTMSAMLKEKLPISGIDNNDENKDLDFIAEVLVNTRSETDYSKDSFINSYMMAEGLMYVRNGGITVSEFFRSYSQYLDSDYASYHSALREETRNVVEDWLKVTIPDESFAKTYNNIVFAANMRTAVSYSEMQSFFEEYKKTNNISTPVYDSLSNKYYKELVFKDLYENKETINNVQDVFDGIEKMSEKYIQSGSSGGGSGSSGGGGGGGSIVGSKPITPPEETAVPTEIPSTPEPTTVPEQTFNDISNHWAKDQITKAAAQGIVNGYEDGSFRPENKITRAEMAKIIVKLMNKQEKAERIFDDVSEDAWYYPYVGAASDAGYIIGDNGIFRPEENITREDVCVIIYRATADKLKPQTVEYSGYSDEEEISDYASSAVRELTLQGIIDGDDTGFAPKRPMKRGEIAAVIARLSEIMEL